MRVQPIHAIKNSTMRILVYKRTHDGDPDQAGCFGACDCMGTVRNWQYDAVIGVGGVGSEPIANGIAGKINWIGIGPHKTFVNGKRGPEVRFDHFLNFGKAGPAFTKLAPALAQRLYTRKARFAIVDPSDKAYSEVCQVVSAAQSAPPSGRGQLVNKKNPRQCKPPSQSKCQCTKKPTS